MKFTIYGRLIGLNEYTATNRTNRFKANKQKQDIEKLILSYLEATKIDKVCIYPIKLQIAWYEPNKRRDIDNITFATKFIQDAMVKSGILIDDSQKYINGVSHEVLVDKDNPRIEVEIIQP